MRTRLTLRSPNGCLRDVEVRGPAGTTVADISPHLGMFDAANGPADDGSRGGRRPDLWIGSRLLPGPTRIGGPGLRHGSIVGYDQPGRRDVVGQAILRLHVVCGPDAGMVAALPRGTVTIGRGPDCDVRLTDMDCSREHVELTVAASGLSVRDLGSSNGTRVLSDDGTPDIAVDSDGAALRLDEYLATGNSILCVTSPDGPAAATTLSVEGDVVVNRPPRLDGVLPSRQVCLPEAPTRTRLDGLPWLAALVPAMGGAALAWWMHNVQFLAFMVLSPIVMLATSLGERVSGRRSHRRQGRDYRHAEAEAEALIAAYTAVETRFRRRAHPDPAALLHVASTPAARVWERRREDADFLDIRIGLADRPASLQVRRGSATVPPPTLRAVPVWADLQAGPLGVCGPRALSLGVARWAVTQAAALQSPADVRFVVVVDEDDAQSWAWMRWLPHTSSTASQPRIARTAEQRQSALAQLLARIDGAQRPSQAWTGPWTVLVVDRACALSDAYAIGRVLAEGAGLGITGICLDDDERRLPAACASVVQLTGDTGTRITLQRSSPPPGRRHHRSELPPVDSDVRERAVDVLADHVRASFADQVARALAPLVDLGTTSASALPHAVRLRELFECADLSATAVTNGWARSDGRAHTPLGITAEGVFDLDLGRDGPHALIAGTTGSGKSELLQSIVAGLAVYSSPQDLQFVLIDYKGGAAFADCARLPHTVGLVTDLDGHLTERALRSLEAELKRRESLFAHAGTADLAAYRRSAHHRREHLGRLVLVVDEFAALVDELPDFVAGLVGIAQRGRSLGIHLILATQRPAGAVSAEIRANVGLRIALRVADAAESTDVLGCDDAARIDRLTPGRAILSTGHSLTGIQIGRIAAPVDRGDADVEVLAVDRWGETAPGRAATGDTASTDLHVLVEVLNQGAALTGRPAPRRPWLEPLPSLVDLTGMEPAGNSGSKPENIVIGVRDLPAAQMQQAVTIDLALGTTMLLAGGARSGRTSALRTVAAQAAAAIGVDGLHIYGIDCAGSGLRVLQELPHCGAVIGRDAPTSIGRLLALLNAEIHRRAQLFAQLQAGSLSEARAHIGVLPAMLLLLDGWEGFLGTVDAIDSGQAVETLLTILREGPSVGLVAIVTGDRAALSTRLSSVMQQRFTLRLADSADYAMAGIARRAVPTEMPPGRAIDAVDASEIQLGVLGSDPSVAAQVERVLAVAAAAVTLEARNPTTCQPIALRPLPIRVTLGELGRSSSSRSVVLGCGGDAATRCEIDLLGDGRCPDVRFLIAGPPRSGRSTVLETIAGQVEQWAGIDLIVAAGRRSGLLLDAPNQGGRRPRSIITPDDAVDDGPVAAFTPLLRAARPTVLMMDDCEQFLDTRIGDWLSDLVRTAPPGLNVVVAGRSDDLSMVFRGVAAEVKRARTGLLLQPGPGDGDIFGISVPPRRASMPAGRGVLVGDAGTMPIQLALP